MSPLMAIAVKASIIVAAALGVVMLLRSRSAALRHWVLAAGLACAAASPLLSAIAPGWYPRLSLAGPTRFESAPAVDPTDTVVGVQSVAAPASESEALAERRGGTLLPRWLAAAWLSGLALSVAVVAVGLGRLSWLARQAERVSSGPWVVAATEASRAYGLRRGVVLLQSDHPTLLVTWGVFRPSVILPTGRAIGRSSEGGSSSPTNWRTSLAEIGSRK